MLVLRMQIAVDKWLYIKKAKEAGYPQKPYRSLEAL